MKNKFFNVCIKACLIVISTSLALFVAEFFIRCIDGYSIASLRLVREKNVLPGIGSHKERFISYNPEVNKDWYQCEPDQLFRQENVDPFLVERCRQHPGQERKSVYQWNYNYLKAVICVENDRFDESKFDGLTDVFVFKPKSGTIHPRYRFLQSAVDPSGLVTNSFGWRGENISLNKGERVIRIAFVGASTTVSGHSYPFSYPEYVEEWLNIWAKSKNLGVIFECINAGRSGINSQDISEVVVQEILPVEPDLVLYYEGSNQFWPAAYIRWPNGAMPPKPTITFKRRHVFENYSAVVRRILSLTVKLYSAHGREPPKENFEVVWPKKLDEFDPDLNNPYLPLNLPVIMKDFDKIRESLGSIGAELVLTSFVWLAHDGMILELPKHEGIYRYLNSTFWPFSYAHIRRMADFQNRTYKKYAKSYGLDFIDIADDFPQDPDLHTDAIHMRPDGIKLRGWIVFNKLIPIIERKMLNGELPRVDQHNQKEHPAFVDSSRTLFPIEKLKKECTK